MTTQHRRDVDDLASGRNDGYAEQLLRDRLAKPPDVCADCDHVWIAHTDRGCVRTGCSCTEPLPPWDQRLAIEAEPTVANRQEEPATEREALMHAMAENGFAYRQQDGSYDLPLRDVDGVIVGLSGRGFRIEREARVPAPFDTETVARALVEWAPGYLAYPESGTEREGIPYKLNALYEAKRLIAILARLSNQPSTEPECICDEDQTACEVHEHRVAFGHDKEPGCGPHD